jgi:hypothetical protein
MYQQLAWDPESLRAALEAELRRRGLHRDLRYMSTAALSVMFEVYVSFVKDEGGGQINSDGGLSLSILIFSIDLGSWSENKKEQEHGEEAKEMDPLWRASRSKTMR